MKYQIVKGMFWTYKVVCDVHVKDDVYFRYSISRHFSIAKAEEKLQQIRRGQ